MSRLNKQPVSEVVNAFFSTPNIHNGENMDFWLTKVAPMGLDKIEKAQNERAAELLSVISRCANDKTISELTLRSIEDFNPLYLLIQHVHGTAKELDDAVVELRHLHAENRSVINVRSAFYEDVLPRLRDLQVEEATLAPSDKVLFNDAQASLAKLQQHYAEAGEILQPAEGTFDSMNTMLRELKFRASLLPKPVAAEPLDINAMVREQVVIGIGKLDHVPSALGIRILGLQKSDYDHFCEHGGSSALQTALLASKGLQQVLPRNEEKTLGVELGFESPDDAMQFIKALESQNIIAPSKALANRMQSAKEAFLQTDGRV